MQPKKFSEYTPITETDGSEVIPILKAGVNATVKSEDLPISTATQTAIDAADADIAAHVADVANPHQVTKAQVGLGNADNTSDANKPVSTAQAASLALKANTSDLTAHTSNTSNPHSVTKAQVGLGNVENTSDVNKPISTATQTALDGKFTQRTITGTTNQVTVTNGDGVSGNPTLSLPQDIHTGASPTFAGINTNGSSLTDVLAEDGVFVIGHRGTPSTAPEHTMEGYRVAVASSVKAIEPDVYMISDNSLVDMHDSTVDRTTTSSGTVASYTASSWKQLVVDASSFLGGGWADQRAPFFTEVLAEFGNKVIIVPEAKNTCMAELCDMLDRFGIGNDMVLLQSFDIDECDVAVARGYKVIWLGNVSVDTADTHSIPFVGPSYTWAGLDTAYVDSAHSKGIGVIAYTVNRLYQLDALNTKGVDGVFSDDPVYLNNRGPKLTEDAWDKQTWLPGTIAPSGRRGTFYAPDWYGFDYVSGEQNACQQGWVSTKDGNTFTIDFTAIIDQVSYAGRWFGIYVGTSDYEWIDFAGNGGNGYHALFRNTGVGTLYRVTNGTATQIGTFTSTSVTLGVTEVQMRLTVTPTNIKWERVDVAASTTVADTTYRGLSCVSLSSNSAGVRYKSLAVT